MHAMRLINNLIGMTCLALVIMFTTRAHAQTVSSLVETVETSAASAASADGLLPLRENKNDRAFTLERKPVWEAGVAGGFIDGFDYPASLDPNVVQLALPFFIYRSPLFRFGGRGGASAVALEQPRVKLDLSIGGSLNAESEGNRVREGLPDLDTLLEIGPGLVVRVFDKQWASSGRTLITWDSELRGVISTDFRSVDTQGLVASTGLRFRQRNIFGLPVDVLAKLAITAGTEQLQDYFYQVDTEFATASREPFDAKAGYLETTLFLGAAIRPFPSLRIFAGAATGFFGGAANADSPLHETNNTTGFALGIVWTVFKSKRFIDVNELE